MSVSKKNSGLGANLMPIIVALIAAAALFAPGAFRFIRPQYLTHLLITVMLCMSLTLKLSDFKILLSRPGDVFLAAAAQFTIMPLLAYALIKVFNLPLEFAVGVVLVGTCPGGISSNIITYLAKGDVPLSVAATTVSTLLAPLLTPLLTLLLIGERVDVPVAAMVISVLKIVLAPIILGASVGALFPRLVQKISGVLPLISFGAMMAMMASIVASSAERLFSSAGIVILTAVFLHNILGYVLGYALSKAAGLDDSKTSAITIEVGMQNTSLASTLAAAHYAALPLAAVPGAIFSIAHSITGVLAASWFAQKQGKKEKDLHTISEEA